MHVQKKTLGFQRVYFTDTSGKIVEAAPEDVAELPPFMNEVIGDAVHNRTVIITDLPQTFGRYCSSHGSYCSAS